MSNAWKSSHRAPILTAILLVTTCLVIAIPAAATTDGPGAASATQLGPASSGLFSWSVGEWMGQALDWVGALWEHSGVTADPNGQSAKAAFRSRDAARAKALSQSLGADRVLR